MHPSFRSDQEQHLHDQLPLPPFARRGPAQNPTIRHYRRADLGSQEKVEKAQDSSGQQECRRLHIMPF